MDWVGGLNNKFVSSRYGDYKSKLKVLVGVVSPEASLLGMQTTALFTWSVVVLCAHAPLLCLHVTKFLLIRTPDRLIRAHPNWGVTVHYFCLG